LDPDITPANAEFQALRVAKERGVAEDQVLTVIHEHTTSRQFHFLGEARVNVLELNLDLDSKYPLQKRASR
jgi:K+-transporting ATPase ATPase C chain